MDNQVPVKIVQEINSLYNKADSLMIAGKFGEAVSLYLKAANLIPEPKHLCPFCTAIFMSLGNAYFLLGNFEKARFALYNALSSPEGDNAFVFLRMGQALYEMNLPRAADYLRLAYKADPSVFDCEDRKYLDLIVPEH